MAMDWTTSFQALPSKATASYEHLLGQCQELLEKVARGELAPSSLKDRLPQFLGDEGAEFYRRLSGLSFELFNGLSELQASSTNEFICGLLGHSAAAESPAPSPPTPPAADADPEEWTRWYQSITAFLTEQNERALSRYQVLLEKVADGKLTPASVQEFSRKFMNERTLVFSRDAGEMQMRFYEKLLQLNQEFVASLFVVLVRDGSAPFDESDQPFRIDLVESRSSAADTDDATFQAPIVEELTDFRPAAEKRAALNLAAQPARPKRRKKSPAKGRKKKASR